MMLLAGLVTMKGIVRALRRSNQRQMATITDIRPNPTTNTAPVLSVVR